MEQDPGCWGTKSVTLFPTRAQIVREIEIFSSRYAGIPRNVPDVEPTASTSQVQTKSLSSA